MLCPKEELSALLRRLQARQVAGSADLGGLFVMVTIQGPQDSFTLQVASSVEVCRLFAFLGIKETVANVPQDWGPKVQAMTVQVSDLPFLQSDGSLTASQDPDGLTLWLAASEVYVLDSRSTLFWPQVVKVVDCIGLQEGSQLALYMLSGHRLPQWDPQLHCCVVVAETSDQAMFPLSCWAGVRPQVEVQGPHQICVRVTGEEPANAAWLGMPFHVLHAAGWQTKVLSYPPSAESQTCFLHTPRPGVLQLRVGDVRALHRFWLLTAQLIRVSKRLCAGLIQLQLRFMLSLKPFGEAACLLTRFCRVSRTYGVRRRMPVTCRHLQEFLAVHSPAQFMPLLLKSPACSELFAARDF